MWLRLVSFEAAWCSEIPASTCGKIWKEDSYVPRQWCWWEIGHMLRSAFCTHLKPHTKPCVHLTVLLNTALPVCAHEPGEQTPLWNATALLSHPAKSPRYNFPPCAHFTHHMVTYTVWVFIIYALYSVSKPPNQGHPGSFIVSQKTKFRSLWVVYDRLQFCIQ